MTCDIIPNRLFQNNTYFIFMWLLLLFSVPLDRNSTSKVSSGVSSYRMLFDMGFKKEDIELALRATNYNLEEAIELLNQSRSANSIDAWRRHDDHNAGAGNFEHNNFPQRYPGGPQQAMSFQVSTPQTRCRMAVTISICVRMNQANQNIVVHLQNNNPNLLNAIGVSGVSTNPGLNAIGNMQPMQAQKYLNQGAHNASGTGECQLSNIPILRF